MAGWYFVVTLGVHMQVLPHAQLQSHESGCVAVCPAGMPMNVLVLYHVTDALTLSQ